MTPKEGQKSKKESINKLDFINFKLLCFKEFHQESEKSARFSSTYTKIGTIQRRLAWPLRKDDTQIREAFHIFNG